ncbi:hypothetical protein BKA70DRAFT_1450527 [Coprinopsis sp. MPI-PUGE-AT-0042]|nr:hypothetical protein BKA70DRAFT_1450527 [Coprinopsis sp. MPI-PUGE-AT-0042]
MPKGRTKPKKPFDNLNGGSVFQGDNDLEERSTIQSVKHELQPSKTNGKPREPSHLKTKKLLLGQPRRKKSKVFNTRDEDTFDETTDDEDNQQSNVPPPRVTRSQAAKVTINVDELSDTNEQDEYDGAHTQGDEDGLSDLTPLPSVTSFRKKVLSVEVPPAPPTKRAMYTPIASSIPGTPSASDSSSFRDGSALVCVGTIVYESHGSPSQEADSWYSIRPKAPRVKSPPSSKSKEPRQTKAMTATSKSSRNLPPTQFASMTWSGETKTKTGPQHQKSSRHFQDSAFNHPPAGRPVDKPFLPGPHEKVWIQVGFGSAFGWGRLKRSKHRSPLPRLYFGLQSVDLHLPSPARRIHPASTWGHSLSHRAASQRSGGYAQIQRPSAKIRTIPRNKRYEVCFQDCTWQEAAPFGFLRKTRSWTRCRAKSASRGEPGPGLTPPPNLSLLRCRHRPSSLSTVREKAKGKLLCMDLRIRP